MRTVAVSQVQLSVPLPPRQAAVTNVRLRVPAGATLAISSPTLSCPSAPRKMSLRAGLLRVPGVDQRFPGKGAYAGMEWQAAMRKRILDDKLARVAPYGAESVAIVLGVKNRGELLANLKAAGAQSSELQGAARELVGEMLELNGALVRLAETWPR